VKVDHGIRTPADAIRRTALTVRSVRAELSAGRRLCGDWRSFARYGTDVLLYRVLGLVNLGGGRRRRRITLADGTMLVYRLNRGDIRAIAEIWQLEIYRPPPAFRTSTIVDLGANIGLVSVFLARRCGASYVLAVEPVADNAELTRENLRLNGIEGEVIEAAVGRQDGVARFAEDQRVSTRGMLAQVGREVRLISLPSLLQRLPADTTVDIMKLDVEGAEAEIFAAEDLSWLDRVRLLLMELHPNLASVEPVVERIQARGFEHFVLNVHPPDWLFGDAMAAFARPSEHLSRSDFPSAAPAGI